MLTVEELKIVLQTVFEDNGAAEIVQEQIKKIVKEYDNEQKAAKGASAETAAAHAAMAAAATKAFTVIVGAVRSGIDAYNQYEAAVKGLDSIASGKGIDQGGLQKALDEVTDAMFNATAAAASFKNLLSRGYSLDQATNAIKRLKDAAAFGRQANYTLADAVKSATEGIKNENSVLVDNAGVTKNVAKMWEDYAKARGVASTSLTQAQKVEAEYLGIMQETALQVGDYEKSLDTLAGAQAEAANSARLLATSYGEAMAPTVSTLTEIFTGFLDGIRAFVEACPGLSAGITATVIGLTAIAGGVKAAQAISTLGSIMAAAAEGTLLFGVAAKTAFPVLAILSAIVGIGTAAFTHFKQKTEEAKRAQEEEAQALRDSISEKEASRASLAALAREYTYLSQKTDKTEADKRRLLEIERELAEAHGITRDTVLEQAGAYDSLDAAMNAELARSREEIIAERRAALEASMQAAPKNNGYNVTYEEMYADTFDDAIAYIKASLSTGFDEIDRIFMGRVEEVFRGAAKKFPETIKDINLIDQFIKGFDFSRLSELKTAFDKTLPTIIGADGVLSIEEADRFDAIINGMVSEAKKSFESMRNYAGRALGYTSDEMLALDAEIEKNILTWLGIPEAVEKGADGLYMAADAYRVAQAAAASLGDVESNVVKFNVGAMDASTRAVTDNYTALLKNAYELGKAQENLNKITSEAATPAEKQAAALALNAAGYGWLLDNVEGVTAAQARLTLETQANTDAMEQQEAEMVSARAWLERMKETASDSGPYDILIALLDSVEAQSVKTYSAAAEAAEDAAAATVEAFTMAVPTVNDMLASMGMEGLALSLDNINGSLLTLSGTISGVQSQIDAYKEQGLEPPADLVNLLEYLKMIEGYLLEIDKIYGSKSTSKNKFDPMTASAEDLRKELARLEKEYDTFNKTLADKKAAATQTAAWKKVIDTYKDGGKNAKQYEAAVKEMSETIGYTGKSADEASAYVDLWLKLMQDDLNNAESDGQALAQAIWEIIQAAATRSEIDIDTSSAESKLNSLALMLKGLPTFISNLFDTKPKGGGGGKSKEEREAEEARRAAEEAKRAQEEEYRKALERIDHLKKMDQLTAEQEIDMLLEVQRVHAKTAEQRMEMEEKLYTARKELAEKRYSDALDEIDHLMALDQMSAEQELARLIEIQAQYATTEEQRREMAEKVYAAQKELQQQAYDDALNGIDRKLRMDQIGAEEEIALLEEVARVHAQTAEQRLDIEERLYEARKQLAAQQYSDALGEVEHMLAMDEIDDAGELAMLEHIQSVYAKTEEQRREMEERIYQARKQIQDDAFNDELSRIDRLRSRSEISTQEQIELLEQLALTHAQTAEQQEKAADKIYEAKQKLFSEELSHISELKSRGEISAQEQLEQLEEIARRAELTAQMRIDLEKQIYQAQQALRKEEEAHINRLNKGIIDALKARYEEQRDAEIEHLNESKQAWKDWSDETCAAIQAQIDAIDKQAEAEDREKTDAENLRAIDKAKQALLYETDDYNRRELEKQIAQLEEKRAEQLKEWEREDQKDALKNEMDAVKDKAKLEQEAIQDEIDRVKELYAERLKAASLQAEAERLLMKSNQEEILELIGSYAPDYEATGKTLGERLFAGIQSAMGNITDWYAAFVEGIDRIQQNIAQQTLDSIDRMHAGQYANRVNQPGTSKGVTVNQYMTFETPVESPADTARRVKQMNQRLADML